MVNKLNSAYKNDSQYPESVRHRIIVTKLEENKNKIHYTLLFHFTKNSYYQEDNIGVGYNSSKVFAVQVWG